mmetsp:Transcript_45687/g.138821  ORF Transcript_45687/g.138821 Transcript_45687/m.138821 type:complete len:278 (-) Transcript_45687:1092-1925(-)
MTPIINLPPHGIQRRRRRTPAALMQHCPFPSPPSRFLEMKDMMQRLVTSSPSAATMPRRCAPPWRRRTHAHPTRLATNAHLRLNFAIGAQTVHVTLAGLDSDVSGARHATVLPRSQVRQRPSQCPRHLQLRNLPRKILRTVQRSPPVRTVRPKLAVTGAMMRLATLLVRFMDASERKVVTLPSRRRRRTTLPALLRRPVPNVPSRASCATGVHMTTSAMPKAPSTAVYLQSTATPIRVARGKGRSRSRGMYSGRSGCSRPWPSSGREWRCCAAQPLA